MTRRLTPQTFTFVIALGFTVFGLMGFVPGIMRDFGDLGFAGPDSDAMWIGLGQLSVLHNVMHLAIGAFGFAAAASSVRACVLYLMVGGLAYGLFGVYGLAAPDDSWVNWAPTNWFDDLIHVIAGTSMVAGGILSQRYYGPRETLSPATA